MQNFPRAPINKSRKSRASASFTTARPSIGFFASREQENDDGIDAEVELVRPDGQVRGDLVKLQLKEQAKVAFNQSCNSAVGGIKQTTLRYWLGLCRYA